MKKYKIFTTDEFDRDFSKLDPSIKEQRVINNIKKLIPFYREEIRKKMGL